MHVRYRRLVEQVAKALFALYQRLVRTAQCILDAQAFQFGESSGGKDSHDRKSARSVQHRPLGQDRKVADDHSGRIKQGNAAIALNAPPFETGVGGEELADPFGMIRGLAVQDCFAGSTIERGFEVFHETSAAPERARAKPRTIPQELGDKRVLASECRREVFDERVEETISHFRFDALDDLAQRRVVGRGLDRELFRTHRREVRLDRQGLLTP